MKNNQYTSIKNFETILDDICSTISEGEHEFNTYMAYKFAIEVAQNEPLSDATADAKKWAEEKCPDELHINHGSYIQDGMQHIIEELKSKPSSNRALFSLLNQKDISKSGDYPIPSFMIFQTCIEDDTLYCTSYFRALEVKTFLRINIEEIRLKITDIYEKIPNFKTVKLVIFAFNAYQKVGISPLKKAKIDLMTAVDITIKLCQQPSEFCKLFEEKATSSTVVYLQPLLDFKEALEKIPTKPQNISYNKVMALLSDTINIGKQLEDFRKLHSRHDHIDKLNNQFIEKLKQLSLEFK